MQFICTYFTYLRRPKALIYDDDIIMHDSIHTLRTYDNICLYIKLKLHICEDDYQELHILFNVIKVCLP